MNRITDIVQLHLQLLSHAILLSYLGLLYLPEGIAELKRRVLGWVVHAEIGTWVRWGLVVLLVLDC